MLHVVVFFKHFQSTIENIVAKREMLIANISFFSIVFSTPSKTEIMILVIEMSSMYGGIYVRRYSKVLTTLRKNSAGSQHFLLLFHGVFI